MYTNDWEPWLVTKRSVGATGTAPPPTSDGCQLGYSRLSGLVVAREPKGSLVWLTLEVPGWRAARPGQFVLLKPQRSRFFLARALSVAAEVGDKVSFLVAPVGEGTREICELQPGTSVWVLGPLGNGFNLESMLVRTSISSQDPATLPRLVVVAGGVGSAPFPLFLSRIAAKTPSSVLVLLGFRDACQAEGAQPVVDSLSMLIEAGVSCRLVIATEDGSIGLAKKVTDLLAHELQPGDRVAVCGPFTMSTAVWNLCRSVPDVRAWFSLEAGMACGVGSCHGCTLVLTDGSQARVCRDGPVFEGDRVFERGHASCEVSEEKL